MAQITRSYITKDGHEIVAEITVPDEREQHFALTGILGDGTSGAVGDRLVKDAPELELFERLHSADADGVPMHAEENARYFYANGNHEQARAILRVASIPSEIATAMREENPDDFRATFAAFVDEQRPRWQAEADEARALFERLRNEPQESRQKDDPDETGSDRGLFELIEEYAPDCRVRSDERFDSRDVAEAQASARVQLEDDELGDEERADLRRLVALVDELADEAGGEWRHGEQFIPESEFEDYAQELASDIGAINRDAGWPNTHIDWKAAADALRMDYTEVEIDGTTYLYRS